MIKNNNDCILYLVRHGETDWNTKGIIQGHSDIPLNKNGINQAKNLAKKLRSVNFSAVFSSDLLRAKKTAEIIAMEKKLAIKTTIALRERYFGKYEGKHYSLLHKDEIKKMLLKYKKLAEKNKLNIDTIETNEQMFNRFIPFIREIAVGYSGKNVLIVTHGGVIRWFLIHLGFGNEKTIPPGAIENTAYVKIVSDGIDFFVKETEGIVKLSREKISF